MLTMKTYLVPIGIAISPRLLVSMILILAARPAEGQRELRKFAGTAQAPGRPLHDHPATLRRWPVALALVDMTWGSLLTGLAATAGYWAVRLSAAAD
jgi:hypothetical protein